MSGHSKWAKIHRQKGAADQKRGKEFSKLVRTIIVCAKDGADLDTNFKLRLAVDKAKAANMPKDNIERAIARGSGDTGEAVIEEIIYEGYGPSGIAFLIETATDNRNRTIAEVKNVLTKAGGSLGNAGSVQWMFEHKGIIHIPADAYTDADELQLELIDAGAEDVQPEEGGLTVYASFESFEGVKKWLDKKGIKPDFASLEWIAKDEIAVDDTLKIKLQRIADQLDNLDDVTNFYTNAND